MEDAKNKENIKIFGKGDCPGSRHKCPLGPWCCDDHGNARDCPHSFCRAICCPENYTCRRKFDEPESELDRQIYDYYCKSDGQDDGGQSGGQNGGHGGQDQGGQEGQSEQGGQDEGQGGQDGGQGGQDGGQIGQDEGQGGQDGGQGGQDGGQGGQDGGQDG
ncbi:golgin subfamily A member 6-like protein 2 [Oppia nitens]|uniref:golgin subfamily A member 6-like protein 2 n=1 Tax=Oppia nitens TaxID=1686743 RepID=UPI0023DCD8E9|nr:golgin subfamily A member 6-like protein 2 [Oppia nitens]